MFVNPAGPPIRQPQLGWVPNHAVTILRYMLSYNEYIIEGLKQKRTVTNALHTIRSLFA